MSQLNENLQAMLLDDLTAKSDRLSDLREKTEMMQQEYLPVSVLGLKPFLDGDQYCFLWGNNIQSGVAGFGDTPYKAMLDFNRSMHKVAPSAKGRAANDAESKKEESPARHDTIIVACPCGKKRNWVATMDLVAGVENPTCGPDARTHDELFRFIREGRQIKTVHWDSVKYNNPTEWCSGCEDQEGPQS